MIDTVTKGQNFGIKAVDWNSITDMVNDTKVAPTGKTNITPSNMVQIINLSGDVLPMFSILEYSASSNTETYLGFDDNLITYEGVKPNTQSQNTAIDQILDQDVTWQRVCVLQQPLAHREVGLAIYKGVAKVNLKQQSDLDLTKPFGVIKIDNDPTKMEVTNRRSPDKLIWHNADFSLGVVQLNADTVYSNAFVGLLKAVPDLNPNTYKIVVEDVYTQRQYHVEDDTSYRNLSKLPARPRSLSVVGYYTRTDIGTGDEYAQVQPFFSNDMEGVVNYDDEQTMLNAMVMGRRSKKDVIGTATQSGGYNTWYGEFQP